MADQQQPFDQFMTAREAAAKAYVAGDPAPLEHMTAQDGPATFFAPNGGHREGAAAVSEAYRQGARNLLPDSETRFEVLQSEESGDLAFWTGIQRANIRTSGQDAAAPMDLRITEVFRRKGGKWKLIHRHADTLVETPPERH